MHEVLKVNRFQKVKLKPFESVPVSDQRERSREMFCRSWLLLQLHRFSSMFPFACCTDGSFWSQMVAEAGEQLMGRLLFSEHDGRYIR